VYPTIKIHIGNFDQLSPDYFVGVSHGGWYVLLFEFMLAASRISDGVVNFEIFKGMSTFLILDLHQHIDNSILIDLAIGDLLLHSRLEVKSRCHGGGSSRITPCDEAMVVARPLYFNLVEADPTLSNCLTWGPQLQ